MCNTDCSLGGMHRADACMRLPEERPHLLPPSRGPLAVVHVLPACRHRELLLQAVLRHRHTCALA